jgi:hypothetical protein
VNHRYVIRPQMPFLNVTLLLLCQPTEYFPQMPSQFVVQNLAATFRDENYMVCTPTSYGIGFLVRPSWISFSCAWRLTLRSFRDGLRYLSNFYCLPGRAGGSPNELAEGIVKAWRQKVASPIPNGHK